MFGPNGEHFWTKYIYIPPCYFPDVKMEHLEGDRRAPINSLQVLERGWAIGYPKFLVFILLYQTLMREETLHNICIIFLQLKTAIHVIKYTVAPG